MIEAFARVIAEREERMLEILRTPQTVDEIVNAHPIYRKQYLPEDTFNFMEEMMVRNHLHRFRRLGLVDAIENGRYHA